MSEKVRFLRNIFRLDKEICFQRDETRFQNAKTRLQNAKTAWSRISLASTWTEIAQKICLIICKALNQA